eukprot:268498_1
MMSLIFLLFCLIVVNGSRSSRDSHGSESKSSASKPTTTINLPSGGFDYPPQMPPPILAQDGLFTVIEPDILKHETAIQLRFTSIIVHGFWNCVAYYHPSALDSLTIERPRIIVPTQIIDIFGTSETRAMCIMYMVSITFSNYLAPINSEPYAQLLSNYGLNPNINTIHSEISSCNIDDTQCLQYVADAHGFVPEIIASIISYDLITYLQTDGWNGDGTVSPNGLTCSANCIPYRDITEYTPAYHSDPTRWKPLEENDGFGFLSNQVHVVPHIGRTAKTFFLDGFKTAMNPNYDYQYESNLVIQRLRKLATNDTMKILVEFFDNKIAVDTAIIARLDTQLNWSFEERQLYLTGASTSEYESVIQVWREKRYWDLVRPTTYIQEYLYTDPTVRIETYGGPYQGVQKIYPIDFQTYIRTMPHSEYPSASACIFTAVTDFAQMFIEKRWNLDSISIPFPFPFEGNVFETGSSMIEPDVIPQNDLQIVMGSLKELRDTGSNSRLWGGMHFTKSIYAAYDLCDGIGEMGYRFVDKLLDGKPL